MKCLILAAGYATRLYPLTKDQPKPLLKVAGKPIIEYILEKVQALKDVTEIYIITNARFHQHFHTWLDIYPSINTNSTPPHITLINDGTVSNEDRLGAVGDIHFVLKQQKINEDLLVIAGDNLFGFSLRELISYYGKNGRKSLVAVHDLKDAEKVKGRYGVVLLNKSRIVDFEEKPQVPKSSLASTACYLFNKNDLRLVEQALRQGKADNPGDFIKFLVNTSEVHGFVFEEHCFDVGTFESLREAEELYLRGGQS